MRIVLASSLIFALCVSGFPDLAFLNRHLNLSSSSSSSSSLENIRELLDFQSMQWKSAGPNDLRGPCPGTNTLANHGILPRSGSGITMKIMVNALVNAFNLDSELAAALFQVAAIPLGIRGNSGEIEIDLKMLRKHGVIEHDASLTRYDFGDQGEGKDNFTPQKELVEQLKSLAVNGYIDWNGMAKARLLRIQQEKISDKNYTNPLIGASAGLAEAFVSMRIMGDGTRLPEKWIDSWFVQEKIPEDWNSPSKQLGIVEFTSNIAAFKLCVEKQNLGLNC